MAAASYYKLDSFPPSDQTAPASTYVGNTNKNLQTPVGISVRPTYHKIPSSDTYPIEPPSKPFMQTTSTRIPRPLKLSSSTSAANTTPNDDRLRQQKHQRWRRYLRILKILTKLITTIFAAVILGIMIYILVTFQTTKGTTRNGRNPWPRKLKLWPTIMLTAGAAVTFLLSVATLVAYCLNFDRAQKSWKLTVVKYVIHIVVWIVISTLYRYEKGLDGKNNDLWGWACSQETTAIQQEFRGVVEFTPLCNAQSRSFEVSVAEAVVKILFAVGHFIIYRKTREGEKRNLADGVGGAVEGLVEHF